MQLRVADGVDPGDHSFMEQILGVFWFDLPKWILHGDLLELFCLLSAQLVLQIADERPFHDGIVALGVLFEHGLETVLMKQQDGGLLVSPCGEHAGAVAEHLEVSEVGALNICLHGETAGLEETIDSSVEDQVDWLEGGTEAGGLVDAVDVLARVEVLQLEAAHQARDERDVDVAEERVVQQVVVEHLVQNLRLNLSYF